MRERGGRGLRMCRRKKGCESGREFKVGGRREVDRGCGRREGGGWEEGIGVEGGGVNILYGKGPGIGMIIMHQEW